jgi:uncharacterized protein (DUF58 family)
MKYLDPLTLARFKGLSLNLRSLSSEGLSQGRHRSPWKGFSRDFAEHRAYAPGDEIKNIDWKVYARADRFYVRQYQSENRLAIYLVLDASGSMGFHSSAQASKYDHACRLAMTLAYLAIAQGDAVGLLTFNNGPVSFLPPRATQSQLEIVDAALAKTEPQGLTDFASAFDEAAALVKKRSLIIFISDLLGDPEEVSRVIKAFKLHRHEMAVLQVLDGDEQKFPYEGLTLFKSMEDGSTLFCDAGALRKSYAEQFQRSLKLYEASFHRAGINYAPILTDQSWEDALGRFLSRLE